MWGQVVAKALRLPGKARASHWVGGGALLFITIATCLSWCCVTMPCLMHLNYMIMYIQADVMDTLTVRNRSGTTIGNSQPTGHTRKQERPDQQMKESKEQNQTDLPSLYQKNLVNFNLAHAT